MRLIRYFRLFVVVVVIIVIINIMFMSCVFRTDGNISVKKRKVLIAHLKGENLMSRIELTVFDNVGPIRLEIEDINEYSDKKAKKFCFYTRFHEGWVYDADVNIIKIFENKSTIRLVTMGATGVGTYEMIEYWIMHCQDRYRIIFMETTLMERRIFGDKHIYKMKYKIRDNNGIRGIYIQNIVKKERSEEYPDSYELKLTWKEQLIWHQETCSFYDFNKEKERQKKAPLYYQRNQAKNRMALQNINFESVCSEDGLKYFYNSIGPNIFSYDDEFCFEKCKNH